MNIKRHIPNLFTFFNLSLGMLAIMICIKNNSNSSAQLAALLILTACFMDRFDGKIARKLGVVSDLGKELDSLSDLISFGVAPAILSWQLNLVPVGIVGYIIILIFPIAGAYRLARFNVMPFSNIYSGIPITVAGGILALYNLYLIKFSYRSQIMTILFIILLSYLMVSKFQIKKR